MEGAIAKHEEDNADLRQRNEDNHDTIQKLRGEVADLHHKDDTKAQQLKAINEMAAEASENLLNKMTIADIKDCFRKIRQQSMPGYVPSPVEETVEQLQPFATPKKVVSTPSRIKTATKRERRPSGPEACEQRNVTLRNRPAIPTTKPTSMPAKKK